MNREELRKKWEEIDEKVRLLAQIFQNHGDDPTPDWWTYQTVHKNGEKLDALMEFFTTNRLIREM